LARQQQSTAQTNKPIFITNQQRDELQAFINERGLDVRDVCEHLAIDALTKIPVSDLELFKGYINDLAIREIHA